LSLKLPPANYARAGGPVIQQELAAVGIKVDITNVEWADWLSNVFTNKDYDLTIVSHVEPNDFGNFGKDGYYFNYKNPKFAELMTELGNTTDPAKQTSIKQDIQKLLANDFAAGFLFEFPNITVANKNLTGFWENAPLPASPIAELKWSQ
jgi:peptide/nickel transport system substrate-binding protein